MLSLLSFSELSRGVPQLEIAKLFQSEDLFEHEGSEKDRRGSI
jgi:hypothetical protein